jgi:hypothetical protein
MEQVVRAVGSFGLLLWHQLDRVVGWLHAFNGQIRSILDSMHVPRGLDGGIIALLWVVALASMFRALPVWARMALVFCTSVMIAKVYGGILTK